MKQWLWQGKPWQAFKTFALLFSFTTNLVLLLVLLLLAPQLLPTVDSVGKPLVGGLSDPGDAQPEAHVLRGDPVALCIEVGQPGDSLLHLVEPLRRRCHRRPSLELGQHQLGEVA